MTNEQLQNERHATANAESVTKSPEWAKMIGQANLWIHEQLGNRVSDKSWRWLPARAANRDLQFELLMTYGKSTVAEVFSKSEMQDESAFKFRVYKLWNKAIDAEWDKLTERRQQRVEADSLDLVAG